MKSCCLSPYKIGILFNMEPRERYLCHNEPPNCGVTSHLTPQQERNMLSSEILHLRSIRGYEKQISDLTRDNYKLQSENQYLQYLRSTEKYNADKQIQKLSSKLFAWKHLKPLQGPKRINKMRSR
ncbi:hypothetical protein J3459_010273 [Metarhizium acridum]|nr:hypothetical protein J3459_010273 [Metarhizium acridum]